MAVNAKVVYVFAADRKVVHVCYPANGAGVNVDGCELVPRGGFLSNIAHSEEFD